MVRTRTRNYPSSYPTKRRRTMATATRRKLSRLRAPEIKYKDFANPIGSGADGFVQQMLVDQGDDGDDYTGSKLYMERLDTTLDAKTVCGGVRLTVLMPKDPTTVPVALRARSKYDERLFTILYDEFIPGSGAPNAERRRVAIKRMQEKISATSSVIISGNVYVCWGFTEPMAGAGVVATRLYFTDN